MASNLAPFLAEQAVSSAFFGKRVAIITRHPAVALAAVEEAATDAEVLKRVYRANGREEVVVDGGSIIRFHHPQHGSIRGTVLDLILVDLGTCDPNLIAELRPSVASTGGHLIGYYC